MHVLLIEPDRVLAKVYKQALEHDGHTLDHALSAQGAVHAADLRKPDVVVVELQLPQHNGVEFLYEFRSYPEWLQIPIIICSFVPPAELTHATTLTKELGGVCCLYKPQTTLAGLCLAVRNLVPALA